jgi:hypothetical protein
MNTLYPIIRRERRPLLPPDEPVEVVVAPERRSPDRPVSSSAAGQADQEIGAPPKHETKTKKS